LALRPGAKGEERLDRKKVPSQLVVGGDPGTRTGGIRTTAWNSLGLP